MRARRVVIPAIAVFSLIFAIYLGVLYGQLKDAFQRKDQFIPTRIYSDVSRIAPAQLRGAIEDKLKSLGYTVQNPEPDQIRFALHQADYPTYLLPENHPQTEVMTQNGTEGELKRAVILHFSGAKRDDLLQSVQLGGTEVQDLYLEPEIVTSLSRSTGKREIRSLLTFDEIPANVWKAIISIEDPRFLEHKGLDPRGIARAIWVNLRTRSFAQGGSTITMQLVKNLMARRTRNLFQKINELPLALLLEVAYDKEEILQRYLNEVYLGQVGSYEVRGVAEGAEHFFGKNLQDLNLAETAMMAGLIRGPIFYSPYKYWDRAHDRMTLVLKKMVETGQIAEAEANAALKMPIQLAPPSSVTNKAPYFADFVKAELLKQLKGKMTEQEAMEAGYRVYTTLDLTMNSVAQSAVARGINDLEKKMKLGQKDRLEGALASIDHSTGYIRVLVGGRSYAQSTFNRILNMKRQIGSTFKPIVFLTAYQKGRNPKGIAYGPGTPVEDAPWTLVYDGGRQSWSPKNYEKEYMGWISLRTALAHSINTSTARLANEVGVSDVIKVARDLGIESELPEVPSLALGVAELSPIELLRAYATFANHGQQDVPTAIRAITQEDGSSYARFIYQPKQVVQAGPADLLTDTMKSVFMDGTAKDAVRLGFDRVAAGKTGTTSNHRDAWFAGYTPLLTTVVWVGMDQPRSDSKVLLTGATSALPIWVDFMKKAHESEPPSEFPLSPNLVDASIDRKSGLLADINCPASQVLTEKYVKGSEPRSAGCAEFWPDSVKETRVR